MDRNLRYLTKRHWSIKYSLCFIIIITFIILIIWQISSQKKWIAREYWSSPSEIFMAYKQDLFHGAKEHSDQNRSKTLMQHCFTTLQWWSWGFLLASLLGIGAGFILGVSQTAHALSFPFVNIFRGLPSAAIWPLCALILGYGVRSQMLVVIFGTVWPILLNTMHGVRTLPQETNDCLLFMKLDIWQRVGVRLLWALPSIFTGLEIGCAIAFLLTITVQILWPANGGIGWYLNFHQESREMAHVFAGLFAIAFMGWGLNTTIHWIRGKVVFWEGEIQDISHFWWHFKSNHVLNVIRDPLLKIVIQSDTVTETIKHLYNLATLRPALIYYGVPFMFPRELKHLCLKSDKYLMQREITIQVPTNNSQHKTILFARSWIDMSKLNANSKTLINDGQMTIGQIIRDNHNNVTYRNLFFKRVISEKISMAFGLTGTIEVIQRTRLIFMDNKPTILIQEFILA